LLPAEFASAIVNGLVDAVVSWEPHTESVTGQIGTGYVQWPLQTDAPFYSVLSAKNDWLATHADAAIKLLKALQQAQAYLENHPTETQQLIKTRFSYSDAYMAIVWNRNI
jgi:ABC-type nitrate/sulfonate/bicarbonate transport system substrate-binding protein